MLSSDHVNLITLKKYLYLLGYQFFQPITIPMIRRSTNDKY